MNKIYLEMKARDSKSFAVSTDNSLSRSRLSRPEPLDFPVLFDENKDRLPAYHVFSMPTTFLIDRNGMIG